LFNQALTNVAVRIDFDHSKNGVLGIENLSSFVGVGGATFSTPVLVAPAGQDTWSYTFTASGSAGASVQFLARLSSGAHGFTGNSLSMGGKVDGTDLGSMGIFKPAAKV